MTLIEIMIVVALIGILTATLIFGSGIFTSANRRAAATFFVVGVRKGLAHANATGNPVRLSLDLGSGRITLEESGSREALRKTDEQEEEEREEREAEEEDAGEVNAGEAMLADAEALAEQFLSGKIGSGSGFSPVDILGQDGESPGRELGKGVRIVKVQTEHDEDPMVDGIAHLYFWPGGMTERAIVQLARIGDEDGVTVVVSPLTGRAEVERGFVDLPEDVLDGEEFSEREEP
jgi:general secretion pathway protein H